jgi:hypothetical protein
MLREHRCLPTHDVGLLALLRCLIHINHQPTASTVDGSFHTRLQIGHTFGDRNLHVQTRCNGQILCRIRFDGIGDGVFFHLSSGAQLKSKEFTIPFSWEFNQHDQGVSCVVLKPKLESRIGTSQPHGQLRRCLCGRQMNPTQKPFS